MDIVESTRKKILHEFRHIAFTHQNHSYNIGSKSLKAVSNCVDHYKVPFEANKIAQSYAKKRGLKAENVIKDWEKIKNDACDLGTRVHDFGERYFSNKELIPELPQEKAIVAYWNSLPASYIPLLCETIVYCEELGYAGTFDLLFYDTERNGVVIADYKTNGDLHKNFNGQKLLKPFDFMLDSPFNKYQLQLSYYQIPLENIDIPVVGRELIWLKNDGTFDILHTMDYSQHIRYYQSLLV